MIEAPHDDGTGAAILCATVVRSGLCLSPRRVVLDRGIWVPAGSCTVFCIALLSSVTSRYQLLFVQPPPSPELEALQNIRSRAPQHLACT